MMMMMMGMSITARSFKGDDMSIGATFTIVEVYDKYKHVRIITHNTSILPKGRFTLTRIIRANYSREHSRE